MANATTTNGDFLNVPDISLAPIQNLSPLLKPEVAVCAGLNSSTNTASNTAGHLHPRSSYSLGCAVDFAGAVPLESEG